MVKLHPSSSSSSSSTQENTESIRAESSSYFKESYIQERVRFFVLPLTATCTSGTEGNCSYLEISEGHTVRTARAAIKHTQSHRMWPELSQNRCDRNRRDVNELWLQRLKSVNDVQTGNSLLMMIVVMVVKCLRCVYSRFCCTKWEKKTKKKQSNLRLCQCSTAAQTEEQLHLHLFPLRSVTSLNK